MADDLRNMTLDDEVAHYLEECKALDGVAVTPENKPRFRKLQEEELRIRKALDAAKAEEKRPHLDANAAIEARFKPKLTAISEAVKAVTAALTKFMLAEEARLRAEAEAKRKAAARSRGRGRGRPVRSIRQGRGRARRPG
jgi:type I site-specific restriction endonuclease